MSIPTTGPNQPYQRRFKHPVVFELEMLVEIAGQCKPRENPERLCTVLSKIVYLFDVTQSQDWLLLTYRDWQRRTLWWLSEKQIKDCFDRLEELGYIHTAPADDKRTGVYVRPSERCNHSDRQGHSEATPTLVSDVEGQSDTLSSEEEAKKNEDTTTTPPAVKKQSAKERAEQRKLKKLQELQPYLETAEKINTLIVDGWQDRDWILVANITTEKTAEVLKRLSTKGVDHLSLLELFTWICSADDYQPRGEFHWLKVLSSPAAWENPGGNGNAKIINALNQFREWSALYDQRGVNNLDRLRQNAGTMEPRQPKKTSTFTLPAADKLRGPESDE